MKKIIQVFIIVISINASAQNAILDEYITLGLQNNLELRQQKFSVKESLESLKQAKGLFFPEITANARYQFARGGRKIDIPVGDMLNPIYSTLNEITNSNTFPQIENMEVDFIANNYHETFLSSSINILNTDIYYNYKARKKMIDVNTAKLNAFTNILKQQIANAYYEYLMTLQTKQILESNKTTVLELKKLNERLYAAGVKTKDAITDAEYEESIIESKIYDSEKNIEKSKSYFNYLLNRDLDEKIFVNEKIFEDQNIYFSSIEPVEESVYNRAELTQLSSLIEVKENLLKMNKSSVWIPKFYVSGNIGFQGFEYKFNNNQFYQYIQLGMRWTISNGGINRSKVREARIVLNRTQLQYEDLRNKLNLEIKDSYNELKSAIKLYETEKKSLEFASETFQLTLKRYNQDQALWIDLVDKKNKLLTAQLKLSISKYNVLIKRTNYNKSISIL